MWFELRKEDIELVSNSLECEEIKCLPQAYQIMQKIVGAVNKEPGRADLVDTFMAVAATLDKLILETKNNNCNGQ